MKVDRKYTHFAVHSGINKVVDGWDLKKMDKDSVLYWTKIDLKNNYPDVKVSRFKVLTKAQVIKMGIDPMDWDNWIKPADFKNL